MAGSFASRDRSEFPRRISAVAPECRKRFIPKAKRVRYASACSDWALARAGDTLHYYEINPLVEEIANRDFGFLTACPASKRVFLGDGRLVLEALPDESLDVLVLDVFSSDAIPVHLLTREAFAIYQR